MAFAMLRHIIILNEVATISSEYITNPYIPTMFFREKLLYSTAEKKIGKIASRYKSQLQIHRFRVA